MSKYRLYLDEVGNPDLEHSEDPNHRFLSLTGVICEVGYVQERIHPEMEALKTRHFGSHPDEPLILHRSDIVNKKYRFATLRDPEKEKRFNMEILGLLRAWDYRVITVCIDKKKHRESYKVWRYDPYHYCLAILLERFTFWLNRIDVRGDVMAESRGGKEDQRLKHSFSRLLVQGTDFVSPERFLSALTSRELKIKPKSANISGLQLADLLAHPSRCEILAERNLFGREIAPFAGEVISILQSKYDQHEGRLYGKKFI